jgi:hypothetical protein
MPQEIELKLALDPRDALRLRDGPILRAPNLKPTARQRLVSTCYDTPSFSLQRSGIILRVRKIAIVCLDTPRDLGAIGYFYRDFHQVSDDEVIAILRRFPANRPAMPLKPSLGASCRESPTDRPF